MAEWYQRDAQEVARELGTDVNTGLAEIEAASRMQRYGPNELIDRGMKNPWRILWEQFTAVMVLILVAAAVVSAVLGKTNETLSILAIVVLFGLLGFIQEYRAERAMAALKRLSVPVVRVRRNGAVREISSRELVPGDVILLEAGNRVPADCRVVESASLRIQEAALTGESEPVEKESRALSGADLPLGDRRNMAYLGTNVTFGRGVAIVTETGMRAELGKIADMIQSVKQEQTPLQQRLDQVGKALAVAGLAVALFVAGFGLLRGEDVREMFLTGVSVAVAVVPEGLPAVVTMTLALGARRMLKRRALIRKLPAVETLGSVTVICSDKTGTLTQNRMTVVVVDVAGHRLSLDEHLRNHVPVLDPEDRHPELVADQPKSVSLLFAAGALCNDAVLKPDAAPGRYHTIGDPTEGALLVAAAQVGLVKDDLERMLPRVAELPFDSDRKRMTTVHRLPAAGSDQRWQILAPVMGVGSGGQAIAFTKGSVDGLLDVSSRVWVDDHAEPMNDEYRTRIEAANNQMANGGMRVLGAAFRLVSEPPSLDGLEQDLMFVGLVGMIDPPRPEVKAAVETCKTSGIRPVMITGDHPLTALAIADQLGISSGGKILTGADVSRMSADELMGVVDGVSVFARVSPEHKLMIVGALQSRGHIVAMTGDGVNDAPALKKADIGVAMGITGTDVSKEASDMVLLDDNFATIVSAVEEGRTIYDNVRRFVKFAIAGNIGKVGVMIIAPFLGMPIALLPLQLLWLNLLTDGLLGLGMGFEPPEPNTMRRPPYSPKAGIFSGGMGLHVVWVGLLIAALVMGVGYAYWSMGRTSWQTMVFTALAFSQVGQALAARAGRESVFKIGILGNKVLLGLAGIVVAAQLAALYLPFTETFFYIERLSLGDLTVCAMCSVVVFAAVEIEKAILRRSSPKQPH